MKIKLIIHILKLMSVVIMSLIQRHYTPKTLTNRSNDEINLVHQINESIEELEQ